MYRQQKRPRPSPSFSAVGALVRVRLGCRRRRRQPRVRRIAARRRRYTTYRKAPTLPPPPPLFLLVRKHRLRISTKQPERLPHPTQLCSDRALNKLISIVDTQRERANKDGRRRWSWWAIVDSTTTTVEEEARQATDLLSATRNNNNDGGGGGVAEGDEGTRVRRRRRATREWGGGSGGCGDDGGGVRRAQRTDAHAPRFDRRFRMGAATSATQKRQASVGVVVVRSATGTNTQIARTRPVGKEDLGQEGS